MCRHSYEYEGHRSYGGNIPGYAQGAYFPGDEPGTRCNLSGETCAKTTGDYPLNCEAALRTEWLCPECQKSGVDAALYRHALAYVCSGCGEQYTAEELPRAFTSLLIFLVRELDDARDFARTMTAECTRRGSVLEEISKAAEAAASCSRP